MFIIIKVVLDSSAVEHSAVNRRVVGSNPTRGAKMTSIDRDVYGSFFIITNDILTGLTVCDIVTVINVIIWITD